MDRRREVSRGRASRDQRRRSARPRRVDAAQPQPPRSRRPGRRRHGARRGHDGRKPAARRVSTPPCSLPILIHGDAAFPGQGVVAETLNLSRLPGYGTGGTIHIIVNNQLGFTTGAADAYSTLYASGLARGFKIPIVHVNADDPEACVEVARLAFAYRAQVPPRLPDRPHRLSPSRAQRGGRALVHAADDVREDRRASDGARALGADARGSRRSSQAGAGGRAASQAHRGAAGGAWIAAARAGLHRARAARRRRRARPSKAETAVPLDRLAS